MYQEIKLRKNLGNMEKSTTMALRKLNMVTINKIQILSLSYIRYKNFSIL